MPFHVKYILKGNSSSDFKSCYLGNGEFKRDYFGYNVQGLQATRSESDDSNWRIRYSPLYWQTKCIKTYWKEIKNTKKCFTHFHKKVIRKEFNKLDSILLEFVDEKDDIISIETELETFGTEHPLRFATQERRISVARMCIKNYIRRTTGRCLFLFGSCSGVWVRLKFGLELPYCELYITKGKVIVFM